MSVSALTGIGGSNGSAFELSNLTFNKVWNDEAAHFWDISRIDIVSACRLECTRRCWYGASSPWHSIYFLSLPAPPSQGFIRRVAEQLKSRFGINIARIFVFFFFTLKFDWRLVLDVLAAGPWTRCAIDEVQTALQCNKEWMWHVHGHPLDRPVWPSRDHWACLVCESARRSQSLSVVI